MLYPSVFSSKLPTFFTNTFTEKISSGVIFWTARFFVYKEHLYKELEAEKGSQNKEFLKN